MARGSLHSGPGARRKVEGHDALSLVRAIVPAAACGFGFEQLVSRWAASDGFPRILMRQELGAVRESLRCSIQASPSGARLYSVAWCQNKLAESEPPGL